jgi:hypothetical protein
MKISRSNPPSTSLPAFILALLLLGASTSPDAMSAQPMSRSAAFHLDAPCPKVFPFFTAEGEKQWAEGWNPEMLSGNTERGSVFRTRHPDGRETTWIVTRYDPVGFKASYARLAAGSNMGLVDVACAPEESGSRIQVTYTLTGLNAAGDAYVREFLSPSHYEGMIEEWSEALRAALQTRTPSV